MFAIAKKHPKLAVPSLGRTYIPKGALGKLYFPTVLCFAAHGLLTGPRHGLSGRDASFQPNYLSKITLEVGKSEARRLTTWGNNQHWFLWFVQQRRQTQTPYCILVVELVACCLPFLSSFGRRSVLRIKRRASNPVGKGNKVAKCYAQANNDRTRPNEI